MNVWFEGKSPAVTFRAESDGISLEQQKARLKPGDTINVGFVIDARGVPPGRDLLKSVELHADPTEPASRPSR